MSVAGSAVAGGVIATGGADAQSRVTRRVVIPKAEDFARGDYDGFFLHVGETTPGELDVSTLRDCEFRSWAPDGVTNHRGTLVDHVGDEVEQVPTSVHTNEADDLRTGSLWVINGTVSCPDGYVGLTIEQVGAAVPGNVTESETATEGTGAVGPGFGALAGAAGVGGLLALLGRVGGDGGNDDG